MHCAVSEELIRHCNVNEVHCCRWSLVHACPCEQPGGITCHLMIKLLSAIQRGCYIKSVLDNIAKHNDGGTQSLDSLLASDCSVPTLILAAVSPTSYSPLPHTASPTGGRRWHPWIHVHKGVAGKCNGVNYIPGIGSVYRPLPLPLPIIGKLIVG